MSDFPVDRSSLGSGLLRPGRFSKEPWGKTNVRYGICFPLSGFSGFWECSFLDDSANRFPWSFQAHSSVEKAGLISLVKMKFLPVDENFSLRGEALQKAIKEDRERGLVPVFVSQTTFSA